VAHYLARQGQKIRKGWVKRFAPRLWTVDFPRPMMAALTNPRPGTARVDLAFLRRGDLAGLIWSSEDRWSHPLLAYEAARDYRGCALEFEWTAGPGLMPLDAVNGPTLTIEGRGPDGAPRTWYVRLWNYAAGSPTSARVRLDFDALAGGFLLPQEADPVWAGDIDRMFISLVPVGFDGSDTPLGTPIETWAELSGIRCTGAQGTLAMGDAYLPEHDVRIASGYDDSYNQAPERLVEQWVALGYRRLVNHYVGMSHFFGLRWDAGEQRYLVDPDQPLCAPAVAWHRRLAQSLAEWDMRLIVSLSYELFDAHAPGDWAQRTLSGERAQTGYVPPSTLLSPCAAPAMDWLQNVARRFIEVCSEAGAEVAFQVGEPWWWVGPDGRPCFYDAATVSRWTAERDAPPPAMTDVLGDRSPAERAWLDWLGARLAESTLALAAAARSAAPRACETMLLFYAPQVLDRTMPDLLRANMPLGWAWPAFDVLQLEDYSFVTASHEDGLARGRVMVDQRLGYPRGAQHYLAGFVADPERADIEWPRIAEALANAAARGVAERLVWAWPQIARDGFTWFQLDAPSGDQAVSDPFFDEPFPLHLGLGAAGGPEFHTQVAELATGFEQRNLLWQSARLRYDAGLGVRSEADLATLLSFFRARRGQAQAFRFRDPLDHSSAADGVSAPTPFDQALGEGTGTKLRFALRKSYGGPDGEQRAITRPVAGTVRVAVNGEELSGGWSLDPRGIVRFETPPAPGAMVTAGFLFDVPARFATDRLEISLAGWRAGEAVSVPLVEVREEQA
jgi:uncharacterized protein (TIGR02217 family)